jgi:hypothetical protein
MRIFSPGRLHRSSTLLLGTIGNIAERIKINYNMDKFNLVVRAARELTRAVQENYYDLSDLDIINYSEVCEWCNFPDLQDGGIYEQAIDAAAKIIIGIIK